MGFFRLVERNAQGIFVKHKIFGERCSYGYLSLLRCFFFGGRNKCQVCFEFFCWQKNVWYTCEIFVWKHIIYFGDLFLKDVTFLETFLELKFYSKFWERTERAIY